MVFYGTFDVRGSKIDIMPDGLHIIQSGQILELITRVEKIAFSAARAQQSSQEMLYITKRAIFQLTVEGVELVGTALGVEIGCDVPPYMAPRPAIRHSHLMESSLPTPMKDAWVSLMRPPLMR